MNFCRKSLLMLLSLISLCFAAQQQSLEKGQIFAHERKLIREIQKMSLATIGTMAGMIAPSLNVLLSQIKYITDNFVVMRLPDGTTKLYSMGELNANRTFKNLLSVEDILRLPEKTIEYIIALGKHMAMTPPQIPR
ncbi:MAG: hypothetical protein LBU35_00530 [Holosporales bacterium]|nr:hypothetical protein [Holosporales bacterium]